MRLPDLLGLVAEPDRRPPEERLAVARHEAAHCAALIAYGVAEIAHVSVIPNGRFAGRTCSRLLRPDTRTREQVEDHVVAILAGRAADATWGAPTTGSAGSATSDLGLATALVAATHAAWCLGDSLIHRAASPEEAVDLARRDPVFRDTVDTDLDRLYARALKFVRDNADAIDRLARRLVADGVVGGDTVSAVLAEAGTDDAEVSRGRPEGPSEGAGASKAVPDQPAVPMQTT